MNKQEIKFDDMPRMLSQPSTNLWLQMKYPFTKKSQRLYFFEDELLKWIEKTTPMDYKSRTGGHLEEYSTLLSQKRKRAIKRTGE